MNLNEFTNDRLPFQSGEVIPRDCTKHEIPMGAVPDEKDNTNPVPYIDKIFAAGSEQPTPVGPADNEIWYTTTDGKIYDLGGIIELLLSIGGTYNGPAVVSNEWDDEKQMFCLTFDGDVTLLGDADTGTMAIDGPFFITLESYGVSCNVKTIILPKTITRIGDYTFGFCRSLTSIEIPNSVTSIGDSAFSDCESLTSVTISNSVTSIDSHAFKNCSSLTFVTIPDSVISIGGAAFNNCTSLASINIPDGITFIEPSTFSSCSSLTSVTIPDSVTRIGHDAFDYCTSLASINIPDGITFIESSTFEYCSSLTSVTIPNSVTSIEYHAFDGCSSLTSVTIPNSVTSIDSYAFQNCSSLASITCEATTPTSIGNDVFINTNDCPIYVPAESVDAYKAATNWSTYADRIQAIQ